MHACETINYCLIAINGVSIAQLHTYILLSFYRQSLVLALPHCGWFGSPLFGFNVVHVTDSVIVSNADTEASCT